MKKILIQFCIFIFLLILSLNVFAMGESMPKEEGNIASEGKVFLSGGFVSPARVIDSDFQEAALLEKTDVNREMIIDFKKPVYLDKVNIYTVDTSAQKKITFKNYYNTRHLLLSTDILNWQAVSAKTGEKNYKGGQVKKETYYCDGLGGQYLKIRFPLQKEVRILEVEAIPTYDYSFNVYNIQVETDPRKAIITFETDRESSVQILFGYNYEFIYERSLQQTMVDFTYRKKHVKVLTDLIPRTSYRFQIEAIDYNGNVIRSDFILFTTKTDK